MIGLALRLLAFWLYCGCLQLAALGRRLLKRLRRLAFILFACTMDASIARDVAQWLWLKSLLFGGRLLLRLMRWQHRMMLAVVVRCRRQSGFGLPELMVSVVIALLLGIFAVSLAAQNHQQFRLHHAQLDVEESGRFALEGVGRAVRQAGYRELGGPLAASALALQGMDSASRHADVPLAAGDMVPGTDALLLRYAGQGKGAAGDGSVLNCAGFGEGAQAAPAWSIYYVARASDGEIELRCKYQGKTGWGQDAVIRGVDGFQILYGIDEDSEPDGRPERFVRAAEVDAMADGWRRVTAVRMGLLLHAVDQVKEARPARRYHLFEDRREAADVIDEATMADSMRTRPRRQFDLTVNLRNGGG